ncbi:MAG: hypothetical protein RMN51_11625 [Verrucomicrobiota bacterium]|nr:hypothetical protein [Limisphaera sp.]MDW8382739.1 hypothetical protein [Verrucomicrobiota bacterium]
MVAEAPSPLHQALQEYQAVCRELLAVYHDEQQCLHSSAEYPSFLFYRRRKDLLLRLEQALTGIRRWRGQCPLPGNDDPLPSAELRKLTEQVQNMLLRILQLDREIQQALLARGLLPPRHLPQPMAQKPHFVADLYRRHCSV